MESWERAIVSALTTGLTIYVISLIHQNVRGTASRQGQRRLLEYGPRLKWMVIVSWIFTAGLLTFMAFSPTAGWGLILTTAALLGGATFALHREFFGVRITYDDEGIQTRSGWRSSRTIPWSDIQKGWYSRALQWYVIQTGNHGRIRLHDFLDGRESLISELRRRGIRVERKWQ
jgi:hypothetical protein